MKKTILATLLCAGISSAFAGVPEANTLPIVDIRAARVIGGVADNSYGTDAGLMDSAAAQFSEKCAKHYEERGAAIDALEAKKKGLKFKESEGLRNEIEKVVSKDLGGVRSVSVHTNNCSTMAELIGARRAVDVAKKVKENGGWAIWLGDGVPTVGTHNSNEQAAPLNYIRLGYVTQTTLMRDRVLEPYSDFLTVLDSVHLNIASRSKASEATNVKRLSSTRYAETVFSEGINGTQHQFYGERAAVGFTVNDVEKLGDLSQYRMGIKARLVSGTGNHLVGKNKRTFVLDDQSFVLINKDLKIVGEIPYTDKSIVWAHNGLAPIACRPTNGVVLESYGRITINGTPAHAKAVVDDIELSVVTDGCKLQFQNAGNVSERFLTLRNLTEKHAWKRRSQNSN